MALPAPPILASALYEAAERASTSRPAFPPLTSPHSSFQAAPDPSSRAPAPSPTTAASPHLPSVLTQSRKRRRVGTGCPDIDQALRGGLDYGDGGVCAVSGAGGTGKSAISLHVLTTHLLASHTSHATVIDTAGAFDVLRLQKIAAQRLKAADGRPSNAHVHVDVGLSVDQMLERVKIMRVFDFVGLVEAVGEVREELESESAVHEAERGLHGRDHDATRPTVADGQDAEEMLMGDEPPTGPRDEAAGQQQQEQQTTTHQERYGMIIVDNITQVAAPIVKSNYIQGHALLTSLLRTLTHLTRTHALCTVLVNTAVAYRPSGSGSTAPPHNDDAANPHPHPDPTAVADAPPLPPHDPSHAAAPPPSADELPSIFAASTARPALARPFPYLVDLHLFASLARSASSLPRRGDGNSGVRERRARGAREAGEGCVGVEVLADRCHGRVGRWGGFVVRDGVELCGL